MMPLTPLAVVVALAAADRPASAVVETEVPLRHVAAADAATAVGTFAREQKLGISVTAEPKTNVVRLTGNAGQHGRVVELLAAIDRSPQQVVATMTFVEVLVGHTAFAGLAEGDESQWVLTPREAKMFSAVVSRAVRAREADIISRPQLTVVDNQTGFFQVESSGNALAARVTPRIAPDGRSMLVRLETQVTTPNAGGGFVGHDIQAVQTTGMIPAGGTLVVRGPCRTPAGYPPRELIVMATLHVVHPAARPAGLVPTAAVSPVAPPAR